MFSALVIQHLAATIERLQQPKLARRPLVIVRGERQLKTLATDERAREAGLRPGDSRAQAELRCPGALVLPAREEVYRRLFADVTADLARCIDKVEARYQPGRAWWLVASDHPQELDVLRRRVECLLGGAVTIGTGSGKFVAQVAGASGVDHCRVAPGEEAAFLAPFPAALLPLNADMARRLPMMGIRSIGEFAALSRAAVFEQWERDGRFCHDLARGIDPRPLQACQPPPTLEGALAFEEPIADRESLLAACLALARPLLRQLKTREAGRLALLLGDDDGNTSELHLRPSAPLRRLAHFEKQLPLLLEQPRYTAGITELTLQLSELTVPQPQQLSLFEASREGVSLRAAVEGWRRRFHQTVYQLRLTDAPRHFPPALQYESEALGA